MNGQCSLCSHAVAAVKIYFQACSLLFQAGNVRFAPGSVLFDAGSGTWSREQKAGRHKKIAPALCGRRAGASVWLNITWTSEYEMNKVVEYGVSHQQEQQRHAHHLGNLHEAVAGLAPRDHLVEQEEHMATVEGRYGQYVHESQN